MQRVRDLPETPLDVLRPLASAGARGLLGGAFGIDPHTPGYEAMRDEFLANYATDLCVHTTLFPGIDDVLDELDARGVRWASSRTRPCGSRRRSSTCSASRGAPPASSG